jgi:GAF domain-containing protein
MRLIMNLTEDTEKHKKQVKQEIDMLFNLPASIQAAVQVEDTLFLVGKLIANTRRSAHYLEQLDVLQDVANELIEVRKLDQLARHILEAANKLIPFTDGSIGLVDDGFITFPYAIGEFSESVMQFKIPVEEGLTGWAVKNKQSVRIADTSNDTRYHNQIKSTGSELDVPIIYNGESIGVINIESVSTNAFTEEHERLLNILAKHAAIAIRNAQLFDKANVLTNIAQQLSSTLDYESVLTMILEMVSELVSSPEVSIGILDKKTNKLHFTLARGPSQQEVLKYIADINQGLTGLVVRTKKPVRVGDVSQHSAYQAQIPSTQSELDVPILFGDQVIGVLNVESPNLNAFSKHDEELLVSVATHAALAIKNAKVYEEVKERLEKTRVKQTAAETMAAIGDFAGTLVHRMNNDVGAIRVRARQVSQATENRSIKDKANRIEALANSVLEQFRSFRDRYKDIDPIELDINQIIRAAIRELPIPQNITVIEDLNDSLSKTFGAEEHLKEVFRNLVANAVEAMPTGGELFVTSTQVSDSIVIKIQDSGTGISDKILPQLFERGFSTKIEGQGLGYGLWWVQIYLNRIGGHIELEATEMDVGSIFTVTLPVFTV